MINQWNGWAKDEHTYLKLYRMFNLAQPSGFIKQSVSASSCSLIYHGLCSMTHVSIQASFLLLRKRHDETGESFISLLDHSDLQTKHLFMYRTYIYIYMEHIIYILSAHPPHHCISIPVLSRTRGWFMYQVIFSLVFFRENNIDTEAQKVFGSVWDKNRPDDTSIGLY